MPDTYVMPRDFAAFATESVKMRESDPNQLWIVKPAAMSRGRGIYMISDFNELSYSETTIVQKYLKNPLLIDGYKFDLRVYVLVTSFQPLEVFIYREGFARMASEKFNLDPEERDNKFVHLTNYSIQKNHYINQDKKFNEQDFFEDNGNKMTLTRLRHKFRNMGISYGS